MKRFDEIAHGDCIWTLSQTQGRGQAGRSWFSDAGVLTASFVIELTEDALGPTMSLCTGLAVAHCAEDLTAAELVHIKWPNDCFANGRKLAGILCEGKRHNDTFKMIVGIGLNVNPQWEKAPADSHFNGRPPISLSELGMQNDISLVDVLDKLRGYLLESVGLINSGRWQALLPDLRKRDCLIDQHICIDQDDQQQVGIGAGIDDHGSLLLRLPDGGYTTCSSSFNLRVMDVIHD